MHQCSDKRRVIPGSNLHLDDVKDAGIMIPGIEELPRLLVRLDSFWLHRRRDIKHQYIRRVIGQNPIEILRTDCSCPVLDQVADRGFICSFAARGHSDLPMSTRAPGNDKPPNEYAHDGNVVNDVGYRAWTDTDCDCEQADQRAKEGERLRTESRLARERRPDPGSVSV